MLHKQKGFTLIELLVTLAIVVILATVAVPAFQTLVAQNRATSAANELLASLQLARSTAVTKARDVTVCPGIHETDPDCAAGGNWAGGWMVRSVADDGQPELIRTIGPRHSSLELTGAESWVFSNTGTLEGQAIEHFTIEVSPVSSAGRTVCMSLAGHARIIRGEESC